MPPTGLRLSRRTLCSSAHYQSGGRGVLGGVWGGGGGRPPAQCALGVWQLVLQLVLQLC